MIAHQLDLFGGPLKPPKKIKVDDDEPVQEPVAALPIEALKESESFQHADLSAEKALAETLTGIESVEPLSHFLDDAPVTNGVEWSPESDEEMVYIKPEQTIKQADNDEELMPDLIPELEGYIDEEPVFTNEAIFTESNVAAIKPAETFASNEKEESGRNEETESTNIVAGSITGFETYEPISHFLDDAPVTNGVEWSPESDEELVYSMLEQTGKKNDNDDELMPGSIPELEGYMDEDPVFTNEAIFTESIADEKIDTEIISTNENEYAGSYEETISKNTLTESVRINSTKNKRITDEDTGLNIPADEELFKRQYYNMRETASMFGVNQSLLRFWENEFDILQPKKNKKGDRYFRPVDIKNLALIYNLLRVRKFTMEGAKEYLNSHKKAADSFEMLTRLEKLKSFLLELKAGL